MYPSLLTSPLCVECTAHPQDYIFAIATSPLQAYILLFLSASHPHLPLHISSPPTLSGSGTASRTLAGNTVYHPRVTSNLPCNRSII